jgi:large subunit ribosomal protein L24
VATHVKKGDTVEVISGDDRGTRAKVLSVDPVKGKLVVEGVNRVYKHVRPSRRSPQGGRLQIERPIDISNVMVINSKTNRPTRVRFAENADGSKKRMATDGTELDIIRKR